MGSLFRVQPWPDHALQRTVSRQSVTLGSAAPFAMRIANLLSLILAAVMLVGGSEASNAADEIPPKYEVVLLPTEDFPAGVASLLAGTVAADTGLRVKAVLPLGTREWTPYPDRPQYDPVRLIELAMPAVERLRQSYGGTVYVVLTSRDFGPADKSLNFLFTQHEHTRKISVVSVARMVSDEQGKLAPEEVIRNRLRKMILRAIAIQFYGLQRSSDIHDVTYSPIMSLNDLDQMGTTMKPK